MIIFHNVLKNSKTNYNFKQFSFSANNNNGDECEKTEVYFKCAFEDKELKEIMTKDALQKLISDVREKM